jgi:pSer/pThr/pTyr-binding forkhead associated (FHA) protein
VCWITIADTTLSAPHLAIDLSRQPIRVKDLNSRNGVTLGGARLGNRFVDLPTSQPLQAGALTLRIEGSVLKATSTQRGGALPEKSYAMPATFVVVTRREMPVVITGDIDHRISDAHALMYVDNDTLMVKDLNSSNGTRVNQKRLTTQPAPAQPGDIVEIGQSAFRVVSSQ